jgi:transglutaminase-like putative cysteine protease
MHIRYGYQIDILCDQSLPLVTVLDIYPTRRSDITSPDTMIVTTFAGGVGVEPSAPYLDQFGNMCRRLHLPKGGGRIEAHGAVYDSGFPNEERPTANVSALGDIPEEYQIYLQESPRCEAGKWTKVITENLSALSSDWGTSDWGKVETICDYVHGLLRYNFGESGNTRTAIQAMEEGVGVSSDFAHIAIALCRSLDIPARFCVGYLGNITSEPHIYTREFSSWFEVFLDDTWWTFDPRHNTPLIGRILVARGRDAGDVPQLSSSVPYTIRRFEVVTEEVTEARYPFSSRSRRDHRLGRETD